MSAAKRGDNIISRSRVIFGFGEPVKAYVTSPVWQRLAAPLWLGALPVQGGAAGQLHRASSSE
jgi:hypothetical protein